MTTYHLNDNKLWEWINPKEYDNNLCIEQYLKLISEEQIDSDYIISLLGNNTPQNSSLIMENLSLFLPRDYFLEVQYCAKTYASIFGQIFPPLTAYVDQLTYIEWLLYTELDHPKYRDHLVHMFKVAFVIDSLLNENEIENKIISLQFSSIHFKEWCKSRNFQIKEWSDKEKKNVIRMASFLTSMFHDFGYGYYFLREYKKRLFPIYEWLLPGADPTDINTSSMKRLLKSLPAFFVQEHHYWLNPTSNNKKNMKIKDNVVAGFFYDCLPLNHSIASTFFLLSIAENLWDARALSQNLYIAFHLAAEAAMIHDLVRKDNSAHLATNSPQHKYAKNTGLNHFLNVESHNSIPLSILLILSDELAVWNRPRIKPVVAEKSVTYEMDRTMIPYEIDISVSNSEIKINPKDKNKDIMKKSCMNKTFKEDFVFAEDNVGDINMLGYKIKLAS